MAENPYQTVNFHFSVSFALDGAKAVDVKFQSVTGLDGTVDIETIKEGGENHYEHVVPTRRKYGPLILKRGLLSPALSGVTTWLQKAFDDGKFEPLNTVQVTLRDEEHQPIITWTLAKAWPTKISSTDLKADGNEVAIETMVLVHEGLSIVEAK